MVKNIPHLICIEVSVFRQGLLAFLAVLSPFLFLPELSDDKVNARIISLVTALNLFFFLPGRLHSCFMFEVPAER